MWRDILSTVEDVQYRGRYHDKCGGILSTVGVFSIVGVILSSVRDIMMHMGISWVLNTPHGAHDISHGTEHPYGIKDIPHMHHDIPQGTEHPHSTQDIPHGNELSYGTAHPSTVLDTRYTG